MTGRERILNALDHKETDKIPIDLGGTSVSGIHSIAYKNLVRYLGLNNIKVKLFDPMMQLAVVDDEIVNFYEIDTKKLLRPIAKFSTYVYEGWKDGKLINNEEALVPLNYNPIEDSKGFYISHNEKILARRGKSSYYFDSVYFPLKDISDIEELKKFKLNNYDDEELSFIKENSRTLRKNSKSAIIFSINGSFREEPSDLRGFENFLMDLVLNRKFSEMLLDKILENDIERFDSFMEAADGNCDIVKISDDYGSNLGLLISPDIYRSIIKPRQKKFFNYIKSKSNYKIFLHSCGSVADILSDLIEIGVDAINPVQISANGMDIIKLKKDYGKDITFWGGTINPADMIKMDNNEIIDDVKRRIEVLYKDGGFVYSYNHNIQPDIVPEKIDLFFKIPRLYY